MTQYWPMSEPEPECCPDGACTCRDRLEREDRGERDARAAASLSRGQRGTFEGLDEDTSELLRSFA